jgi:hypothetical protein
MSEDKKKKDKKKKGGKGAAADDGQIRVSSHPQARASLRAWRGRAGLGAFVVALLLSLHAHLPMFDAVARGLIAGIVFQFVAWTVGVMLWRHLILAELETARERREAALEARREAAASVVNARA